jgi:anti-sigma factor RsiW
VTLPELHLAEEALAAYADGRLSPSADERAARHLRFCAECRAAVDAEREAKALLGAAPDPALPAGLLARLLDVPMTADLGGTDRVLAFDGTELGWTTERAPEEPRVVERRATAAAPGRRHDQVRPVGAARPAARSGRSRRTRRGIAVSLAGLAFGVIASAATSSVTGSAAPRPASPGSIPDQRVTVGTGTSMDLTRSFPFRRPASTTPALVPTAPTP